MGNFFGSLFDGVSLDMLLVYTCALRGIFVGSHPIDAIKTIVSSVPSRSKK